MQVQEMFTEAEDYYWTMAVRHRLITVTVGGSVAALCTFFITTDLSDDTLMRYYDRKCWSLPPDEPQGAVVYIDKLMSYLPWTMELSRMVEAAITQQVPSWQTAVWYRPRHGDLPDRRYTYCRTRRRWSDGSDV